MKCYECGFNNTSAATVCKGCQAPLNRKIAARAADTEAEKRARNLWTAQYECKRYQLEPQGPEETNEGFCQRIDRQKTPYIEAEHRRLLAAADARSNKPEAT